MHLEVYKTNSNVKNESVTASLHLNFWPASKCTILEILQIICCQVVYEYDLSYPISGQVHGDIKSRHIAIFHR